MKIVCILSVSTFNKSKKIIKELLISKLTVEDEGFYYCEIQQKGSSPRKINLTQLKIIEDDLHSGCLEILYAKFSLNITKSISNQVKNFETCVKDS